MHDNSVAGKLETLKALVKWLRSERRYVDALGAASVICTLEKELHGARSSEFARSLNWLSQLYYYIGDYKAAEPLLHQALDIVREALGEDPLYAALLNNLAQTYEALGDHKAAEPLYRQALAIRRETVGEHHSDYADSLNNLALLYLNRGDYKAAEPLLQQALDIRRETVGEHHRDYAHSLNNLALLYSYMGNYKNAEPLLHQALDIVREALGEHDPLYVTIIYNIAKVDQGMGDYKAAEPLLQQALDIRRETVGEHHRDYAHSLNNLAFFHRDIGDYQAAEPLLQQALDIRRETVGEHHCDYAHSLNNLALLYSYMGNYQAAQPLYHQALDIFRKTAGEYSSDYAMCLNNLATLYQNMGDYQDAETLFKQALDIRRETVGEHHPDYAVCLNNLATFYQNMGDYQDAEPLYQQALDIVREALGEHHPDYAMCLNNLAGLYVATERVAEAFNLMIQATAVYDYIIAQIFSIGSEQQRMAYLNSIQLFADELLSLVSQHCSSSKRATRAAMDLVLRRKAIGAEALATQRDVLLSKKYPKLRDRLLELRMLSGKIVEATLAGPGAELTEAYRQRLSNWNTEREQLEAGLARQIPEMNLEQCLKEADHRAIAQSLPAGAVLVEFVRFYMFDFAAVPANRETKLKPPRYLVFVLRAHEPDSLAIVDLGAAEAIDNMVIEFRASITCTGNFRGNGSAEAEEVIEGAAPTGADLRAAVFDPLIPHLKCSTCVLISPDGELTRLPFEALPMHEGRRLIDDYHISYLSAGRDVLRFENKIEFKPSVSVVIADPDYDLGSTIISASQQASDGKSPMTAPVGRHSRDLGQTMKKIDRLPYTNAEGREISTRLKVTPWLGQQALEGLLKENVSPYILHVATHGFFLENQHYDVPMGAQPGGFADLILSRISASGTENPLLRSGLLLAGVNTFLAGKKPPQEAEDGVLTAVDVSGLDLTSTDLAVLSACETGLGDVQTGEGVFGLRRAFMLAGAKTLVISLWKVDDEVTKKLMIDFYKRILAGEGRANALRKAQLEIKKKYPDPYYWGAFICQGDPGPLTRLQ